MTFLSFTVKEGGLITFSKLASFDHLSIENVGKTNLKEIWIMQGGRRVGRTGDVTRNFQTRPYLTDGAERQESTNYAWTRAQMDHQSVFNSSARQSVRVLGQAIRQTVAF